MFGSGANVRSRVDPDIEVINESRESLFRAFNATDLDAFMRSMANDIVVMGQGGPPALVGEASVRSNYKEFFDNGPFIPNLTHSSDEVIVCGDWAFDRGTWRIMRTFKRVVRQELLNSCYIMIWHRQTTGTWKLARIIWNGTPVPVKADKTAGAAASQRLHHPKRTRSTS